MAGKGESLEGAAKKVEEGIKSFPFGPSLLVIHIFTELVRLGGIRPEISARIALAAGKQAGEKMISRNRVKL